MSIECPKLIRVALFTPKVTHVVISLSNECNVVK